MERSEIRGQPHVAKHRTGGQALRRTERLSRIALRSIRATKFVNSFIKLLDVSNMLEADLIAKKT
jgi:hypothetical protein